MPQCPPFESAPAESAASDEPESPDDHPPSSPADPDLQPESTGLVIDYLLETDDTEPPTLGWLEAMLMEAAELAGVTSGRLGVTLIDDERMQQLHADYCDDPTTTDVLTFDLRDEPGDLDTPIDGDLVICRDEAVRQAQAHGHDTRVELLLYAVHGLLHLLGEDDHDEDDYRRMHQREDDLLGQLGLGCVFHRHTDTPADPEEPR